MKVTVCFRDVKVVVPCGDGSGLVKDLLEEAIARYRKVQTKNSDSGWLSLKTVKLLLCDGGILDLDDKIVDVIDDKEQVQAVVDGNNNRLLQEITDNNGDGMSGSSLGTYSPDIFPDNLSERMCNGKETSDLLGDGYHDIVITEQDFFTESGLRVRRGSEPTLCTSSDLESSGIEVSAEYPIYSAVRKNAGGRNELVGGDFKVGHSASSGQVAAVQHTDNAAAKISEDRENEQDKEIIVVLPKSKEALGIHVVPEFDQAGRNIGLLIEKIERGGRADRDHRLQKGDKIVEINFQKLFQVDFPKAQEIFRSALLAPELQIKLLRPAKSTAQNEPTDQSDFVSPPDDVEKKHLDAAKKIPPAVPARSPKTRLSSKAPARLTMHTVPIELVKGVNGLGFSVTTHGIRDGGYCPIYVKNIFSVGAAIEDGRLKPGDVLLEINRIPLANKTKAEAVRLLRNFPTGSTIQLLISRALTPDETPLKQEPSLDRRPVTQRPLSTVGSHPTSTSSCSDRTEEEEENTVEEKEPDDVAAKENTISSRKFGSMSNIAKSGVSDDFDDEDDPNSDLPTGGHMADKLGTGSTLQKSRKSISMDDLRRNFARSGVEVSFDDDVDYPVAPFHKMRDFNQSFRAAVIDKTYNRPATGAGAESAEYIAAVAKIEKLRLNGNKKTKDKKDHERGSGRRFGWLFRFGKGRKSDGERNRPAAPEVPSGKNVAGKNENPPAIETSSGSSGLPVTGPKTVSPHQRPSHPSIHSRQPSAEPVREIESHFAQLHKEDYMITAVPPVTSHPDRQPQHTRHVAADSMYERQRELDGRRYEHSHQHENVSQRQYYRPITSHVHRESPALGPGNIYHNSAYPKTADQRFYHQELLPSGGDRQPPLRYYQDNPGPPSYKTGYHQEHHLQFIKPNSGQLSPQRELRPSSVRSEHYYRQDSFEGQYKNFRPQQNPYANDPAWDQRPLDLSRYAVRGQDRADVLYGFKSRENDLQTRQQIISNLKIPLQSSSIYPPYKNVNPGIAMDSDLSREQARQMLQKSRAIAEQSQYGNHYQAKTRQTNPTFLAERW